ncbi:MAG: hypothetical protein F6K26_42920 [Moorea sp. SIO2I5]|nr:hypothetical protein [Moorena sp. SIO2I5]
MQPNETGRVHFRASYWNAKCPQAITLNPGDIVEVTGIDNITLILTSPPAKARGILQGC